MTLLDLPMLLPILALVLARISGLLVTAPVLSSGVIPVRVKVYLALAISLLVMPSVASAEVVVRGWPELVAGVLSELAVGAVMGFTVNLAFVGLQIAAQAIGRQAGIALARTFNPALQSDINVIGNLYYWTAAVAFLAVGGHRALIGGVLETYSSLPLMSFAWAKPASRLAVDAMGGALELAVRVAWPAILALLLTELALGFINRTVPQLNILMVGFSLRTAIGLVAAMLSMALAIEITLLVGDDVLQAVLGLFGELIHAA